MNTAKAIEAIKEGKCRLDRLSHEQACEIVLEMVERRLLALSWEHGSDFKVHDANELETCFGHIQDSQIAFKIADWHLNAGATFAVDFVVQFPDCDICAA